MLRPAGPTAADDAWAASMLTAAERPLYTGMGAADRRHAVDGARAVEVAVAEPYRRDAVEAALVHDVGKRHARLGVIGRSVATVVGWFVRTDARRAALAGRSGWAGRVGRYLRHDVVGAEEVAAAGGSELAVAWTAGHHHAPARVVGAGRGRSPRSTPPTTTTELASDARTYVVGGAARRRAGRAPSPAPRSPRPSPRRPRGRARPRPDRRRAPRSAPAPAGAPRRPPRRPRP